MSTRSLATPRNMWVSRAASNMKSQSPRSLASSSVWVSRASSSSSSRGYLAYFLMRSLDVLVISSNISPIILLTESPRSLISLTSRSILVLRQVLLSPGYTSRGCAPAMVASSAASSSVGIQNSLAVSTSGSMGLAANTCSTVCWALSPDLNSVA